MLIRDINLSKLTTVILKCSKCPIANNNPTMNRTQAVLPVTVPSLDKWNHKEDFHNGLVDVRVNDWLQCCWPPGCWYCWLKIMENKRGKAC